jgi:ELKS/RAB6-interacting/CAST family protein 1
VEASSRISQQENEILQREKDKQSKEILILRKTVDEMELRIDIQKQTLAARDESMKKLLEMLQSKGHSISNIQENQLEIENLQAQRLEDERKIKQLQNELSQQSDESTALKEVRKKVVQMCNKSNSSRVYNRTSRQLSKR